MATDVPLGVKLFQCLKDCVSRSRRHVPSPRVRTPHSRIFFQRTFWYKLSVLFLTFLSYTTYHLTRKPISVVKNVLNQNCSGLPVPPDVVITNATRQNWCDWAPFNGSDSETLLGILDSAFLFSYAFGMFLSGFIAERVNLRYFLSLGMLGSAVFTYMFGLGYTLGIHQMSFYTVVQIIAGFFQTTGWPSVVTAVGNWFGKGKRGLIFGIWNSHTSVGNILGSLIAGEFVEDDWGLSFYVPAIIMGGLGFLIFLFLVTDPRAVGCPLPDHHNESELAAESGRKTRDNYDDEELASESETELLIETPDTLSEEESPMLSIPAQSPGTPISSNTDRNQEVIGFWSALRIPGVVEFSFSLFFSKLVSYTFLYWLPRYINASTSFSPEQSADMSTLFDVGGIVGGIVAGIISDHSGMSACTCSGMLILAIPLMLVYEAYGHISLGFNIALLMIVGLLVNGPYSLITTAVSAELGTHPCLQGNSKALATVTAIIDGTGSIGAAVGPLLAGPISDHGWNDVFYMLMFADVIALLLLLRLVKYELQRWLARRRAKRDRRQYIEN